MKSPLYELQKALFTAITGMGFDVYDGLPEEDAAYPFIVLDNDVLFDASEKTRNNAKVLVTLYIWSRYKGAKEVKQLSGQVIEVLMNNESLLQMSGFTCERLYIDTLRINRVQEGNQWLEQAVLTVGFLISEN